MFKKKMFLCVAAVCLTASALAGCSASGNSQTGQVKQETGTVKSADGSEEQKAQTEAAKAAEGQGNFKPSATVEFIANSKAGSNIDIFARSVVESMKADATFAASKSNLIIVNQEDGNGAVAQRQVSALTGEEADNKLLTLNVGDLESMLMNTDLTVDDFTILGILVQDKHYLYVNKDSSYQTFDDFVKDVKGGANKVIAGGRGDDIMFGSLVRKVLGAEANLNYLQTGGTNDTAVQVLGNQVDIGIGKASVLNAYLESGDVRVLAVEGPEPGAGLYEGVPTLESLGYGDINYIQCRAIAGSKNMSPAAVAYWEGVLKSVAESEDFDQNYVKKYDSMLGYMDSAKATAYFKEAEKVAKGSN